MFPSPLRREILTLLAVKAVLLAALYLLFFSPPHRQDTAPHSMASHLLGGE